MKLLLLKHYAIQIKLKSKMIRILIYLSLELKDEPLVFKKRVVDYYKIRDRSIFVYGNKMHKLWNALIF